MSLIYDAGKFATLLEASEELVSLFSEYGMARLDKAPMGWGDIMDVGNTIEAFVNAIDAIKESEPAKQ